MKKVFCAALLFTSLLSFKAYSQGDVLQNVISKLKTMSTNRIIEKAYLHFDKPYYAAGDTMYFKAYVTLGERHDLTKASGILYVDLIDPQSTVVNTIKLQLLNGTAWGDFALSDASPKGYYRVRAYTRYMQNSPDYFFDQPIAVGSANMAPAGNANAAQALKADIRFFPEGGDLVAGVISKVAFKAIGTNGLGTNVKGVIIDNTNKELGKFSSTHLGMGAFFMEPEEGKTYKAKVTYGDGSQATVDLPAVNTKGLFLKVTDTLGNYSIEVHCNKGYLQDNMNKDLNLLMYDGDFVSSVNFKLDSRVAGLDVPKSKFPSGIVRITLFSAAGEPLSERLVFSRNTDLLDLSLSSDKQVYKKREKVQIGLTAKSGKGVPADGNFSVSVINESKVPVKENAENTILTYLLLTNQLKGYVEQPNYYFSSNPAAKADLDVLMLTQGYRRFSWRQLMSDINVPFSYQPEKDLIVSGVLKSSAGTPLAKKDVLLTEMTSHNVASQKTDDAGKFNFIIPVFMDGTNFMLQPAGSTKDKNAAVISIDKGPVEPMVSEKPLPGTQNDANMQMQAYLDSKGAATAGNNTSALHADQVIQAADVSGATSLTAALGNKLNGVEFVQGLPHLKGLTDPMLVVVNGKIRGSYVNLDNIAPANVENIKVLKGSNADPYGAWGAAGVLVINTRGEVSSGDVATQNNQYAYQGTKVVPIKTVTERSKTLSYRSSNIGGPGHADQVILASDLGTASSLSAALNGRLRGVDIVSGMAYLQGNTVLSSGGSSITPMTIYMDGVPVTGGLDNINPANVEAIEVLKYTNASIYGQQGAAGVIVITSKQGNSAGPGSGASLGSLKFAPKGFYKAREFYSPKYEVANSNTAPDNRSTIFWKPEVITDKSGNASFDFYNADGAGYYRVVVEGIDSAGNLGRQVYRYKVQ